MTDTRLEEALQSCSLHVFLMIMSSVLERSGFGAVHMLDRRETKQKSRFGGHELMCLSSLGILPMKTIVKVLQDPVHLRNLDEMAGTAIRVGADIGIVVSPHRLRRKALANRETYRRPRVEVFDGPVLVDLMMRHGIGVKNGVVDSEFFSELEKLSPRVLNFIEENK